MRALVVFYSRTGNTKRIAEDISKTLNADIEELYDAKGRKGITGWLVSGMDARLKRKANLRKRDENGRLKAGDCRLEARTCGLRSTVCGRKPTPNPSRGGEL